LCCGVDQGFTAWLINVGDAMEFIDRRARPAMHNSTAPMAERETRLGFEARPEAVDRE
jgi:hypothetical protein